MKKRGIAKSILSAMILLLSFGAISAGGHKTGMLEDKIYEIKALRIRIMDKIDQAIEVRMELEQRLVELRGEIQAEQTRFEIHSRQQAMQNLRIRYNLSLIQIIIAYIHRLNDRIDYFQTGNERLRYMVHQINDVIAIINTLQDMEIANLIIQIDQLLNEFGRETKNQLFEAADIRPVSIDQIWSEINSHSLAIGERAADRASISRLK
jgi:hypothetical protein